jgi:hypothetical protein
MLPVLKAPKTLNKVGLSMSDSDTEKQLAQLDFSSETPHIRFFA